MVVSFFNDPGAEFLKVCGESTIWSIERPSSRTWIRIVCVPDVANRINGPSTPTPQPLSCQPHPDNPQPEQSSRFISVALVLPIRNTAAPLLFTLSENCMKTESLPQKSLSALPRIHRRQSTPAVGLKVISK